MKSKLGIFLIVAITVAALSGATPSLAAEKKVKKKPARAAAPEGIHQSGFETCKEDIEKWCKDIEPGQGRWGRRLYEYYSELSAPCRKFASHGGKGQEMESLIDIDRYYVKRSTR